jgi:hypothetical protein
VTTNSNTGHRIPRPPAADSKPRGFCSRGPFHLRPAIKYKWRAARSPFETRLGRMHLSLALGSVSTFVLETGCVLHRTLQIHWHKNCRHRRMSLLDCLCHYLIFPIHLDSCLFSITLLFPSYSFSHLPLSYHENLPSFVTNFMYFPSFFVYELLSPFLCVSWSFLFAREAQFFLSVRIANSSEWCGDDQ